MEPRFQPPVGLGVGKSCQASEVPPICAARISAKPQRQLLRHSRTGRLVENLPVFEPGLKVLWRGLHYQRWLESFRLHPRARDSREVIYQAKSMHS